MESKKYEDYHVLNEDEEEIIDVEVLGEVFEEPIETIQEEIKNEEEKNEIVKHEISKIQVINLNNIDEENDKKQISTVDNNQKSRKYQSVLLDDIDEETNTKENKQHFENNYTEANYGDMKESYKEELDGNVDNQNKEETFKDTSFSRHVETEKKKERSFWVKWSPRLIKLILFIMLLPVIGIVGSGFIAVIGGAGAGILACIAGGLFVIALACFMATQVNTTIVALGISVGITAISFGGIVLILFMMIIRGIITIVRRNRLDRKNRRVR